MTTYELVVGACAGDEGKGTVTARIAEAHKNEHVLNVLTNGGAQRGHSVFFNGKTHIFRHFGSGTFSGARTCYSSDFILNPIQFCFELDELEKEFGVHTLRPIRFENCKWTTPFDMMYNQMESLENWKGTCGMGIWATICRYNDLPSIPFSVFCDLPKDRKMKYLLEIREYYERKIDVSKFKQYEESWRSNELINHFVDDCLRMKFRTVGLWPDIAYMHIFGMESASVSNLVLHEIPLEKYDCVIFENGQGLLLGDTGKDDPEKTPSTTGSKVMRSFPLIENINVHYVTRPYVTRHGSRVFVETDVDGDIDKDAEVNKYNEWQRNLLYSSLDIAKLKEAIENDGAWLTNYMKNVNFNLEVTHCDELDRTNEFKKNFGSGLFGYKDINLNFHGSKNVF